MTGNTTANTSRAGDDNDAPPATTGDRIERDQFNVDEINQAGAVVIGNEATVTVFHGRAPAGPPEVGIIHAYLAICAQIETTSQDSSSFHTGIIPPNSENAAPAEAVCWCS